MLLLLLQDMDALDDFVTPTLEDFVFALIAAIMALDSFAVFFYAIGAAMVSFAVFFALALAICAVERFT
jgi:hypothetical protein